MKSLKHYYIVLRRKIIRPILLNNKLSYFLSKHCLKMYLAMFYENWTGRMLNYRKPEDFNQYLMKLSWINSRDKKMHKLIPQCVDKYAVREYITSKGYADTLNELYGVYDNVEDIDFDSLPYQFVMKMNNACGRNYICLDKSACNWNEVKKMFAEWLTEVDLGWTTGEWQYALIKPRIIIEKYLKDLGETSLIDYKIHVIKGKCRNILVCYNREFATAEKQGTVSLDNYSLEWERTDDILSTCHPKRQIVQKPKQLDKMLQMAADCSKEFAYCRFDLYEIDGNIVFGEMTFTPHGNVLDYYSDDYLKRMNDLCKE